MGDWLAVAPMALGSVIVVSIWQIIDLLRYRWRGTLTTGRVIKLEERQASEGGAVFAPIVEYRAGEQRWRIKSLMTME